MYTITRSMCKYWFVQVECLCGPLSTGLPEPGRPYIHILGARILKHCSARPSPISRNLAARLFTCCYATALRQNLAARAFRYCHGARLISRFAAPPPFCKASGALGRPHPFQPHRAGQPHRAHKQCRLPIRRNLAAHIFKFCYVTP